MEIIEKICGVKKGNFSLNDIGNDPNFVFENDPNFATITLFYEDGKVINVNSWIECANYVNGGWTNNLLPKTDYEQAFSIFLLLIAFSMFIFKKVNKYVKKQK